MKILKYSYFWMGAALAALSCKNDNQHPENWEKGEIWRSGGLAHCAEQIRLDKGDTLVVSWSDLNSLRSGERVRVTFRKISKNENCPSYINSEILKIEKL